MLFSLKENADFANFISKSGLNYDIVKNSIRKSHGRLQKNLIAQDSRSNVTA